MGLPVEQAPERAGGSTSTVYAGEVSGFFETRWLFVGYGWIRLSAAL